MGGANSGAAEPDDQMARAGDRVPRPLAFQRRASSNAAMTSPNIGSTTPGAAPEGTERRPAPEQTSPEQTAPEQSTRAVRPAVLAAMRLHWPAGLLLTAGLVLR